MKNKIFFTTLLLTISSIMHGMEQAPDEEFAAVQALGLTPFIAEIQLSSEPSMQDDLKLNFSTLNPGKLYTCILQTPTFRRAKQLILPQNMPIPVLHSSLRSANPHLRTLTINSCTIDSDALQLIFTRFSNLENLVFNYCVFVTSNTAQLPQQPSLKLLRIRAREGYAPPAQVLRSMLEAAPNLRSLKFSGVPNIFSPGWVPAFDNLTSFEMESGDLKDEAFIGILTALDDTKKSSPFDHLSRLSVAGCTGLTDVSLSCIPQHLHDLSEFDARGTQISSAVFMSIMGTGQRSFTNVWQTEG